MWIFFLGQVAAHAWQQRHSPDLTVSPSISRWAGHLFLQRPHFGGHFSRFLWKSAPGRIGINAKTAPIGQRNWQKKRSCVHIPTMIRTRITIPARYLLLGKRPAVIMEKTSHGLVPVSFPYTPVRQESKIRASTIYLTFWSLCTNHTETAGFYN